MAHIKVLDFGSACHASETGCNVWKQEQMKKKQTAKKERERKK